MGRAGASAAAAGGVGMIMAIVGVGMGMAIVGVGMVMAAVVGVGEATVGERDGSHVAVGMA